MADAFMSLDGIYKDDIEIKDNIQTVNIKNIKKVIMNLTYDVRMFMLFTYDEYNKPIRDWKLIFINNYYYLYHDKYDTKTIDQRFVICLIDKDTKQVTSKIIGEPSYDNNISLHTDYLTIGKIISREDYIILSWFYSIINKIRAHIVSSIFNDNSSSIKYYQCKEDIVFNILYNY